MRPMNNRILIHEMSTGDKTEQGIILPETRQLPYGLGVVVETHAGTPQPDGSVRPSALKVGNLVAYDVGAGVEIMINGEPCRLILEGNVLAVLQEDIMESVDPSLSGCVVEGPE